MKNLVGKKMKGFKFDGEEGLDYDCSMDNCVNKIGEILNQSEGFVYVVFKYEEPWWYPLDKAIEHIIEDETELIPELKGVEMEVSDYSNFSHSIIRNVLGKVNGKYVCNFGEQFMILYKYARPINSKIKVTKQQIAEKFNIDVEKLDIEL